MNQNTLESLEVVIAERNALLAEVARLKSMLPIEPWQPAVGIYKINDRGEVISSQSDEMVRLFGLERKDLGVAVNASRELKAFHRLLAYRDEFEPGYRYDDKEKWYVYYNIVSDKWNCSFDGACQDVKVYMSESVADELCDKLNSGEVVL